MSMNVIDRSLPGYIYVDVRRESDPNKDSLDISVKADKSNQLIVKVRITVRDILDIISGGSGVNCIITRYVDDSSVVDKKVEVKALKFPIPDSDYHSVYGKRSEYLAQARSIADKYIPEGWVLKGDIELSPYRGEYKDYLVGAVCYIARWIDD